MKKIWKKIRDTIKFEYKMWILDGKRSCAIVEFAGPYPPSFFYRNSEEKIEKKMAEYRAAVEKDCAEAMVLIEEYRRKTEKKNN